MKPIRVQVYLARCGLASRRKAEQLITAGRVRVNGRIVRELGTKVVVGKDKVELDGRLVLPERLVYILLNKPRGVVSAVSDPDGKPTVVDLIRDESARIYPVGRLDIQSEGALLLTNDGGLTSALLHPSRGVPKTYLARVRGRFSEEDLAKLKAGVRLEDGPARPDKARITSVTSSSTWVEMVIHEGRNRIVRRMFEALDKQVARLIRVDFAGLKVDRIKPGSYRRLQADEVAALKKKFPLPK